MKPWYSDNGTGEGKIRLDGMPAFEIITGKDAVTLTRNLQPWLKPTVTQMRDTVINKAVIGFATDDREENIIRQMPGIFRETILAGRLFDLGHLPNQSISSEGKRAADLFLQGHIGHPFQQPYALFHTWEGGGSLYLVDPSNWHHLSNGALGKNEFLIAEAMSMVAFNQQRMMMLAGMAFVQILENKYRGVPLYGPPNSGMIGNLTEPVMASLLMLATDGVAVDRIEADAKLNRARVNSGKTPIPGHWRVHTEHYITALGRGKRARGEDQGGQHASPRPHLRRGHIRHKSAYHGGGDVWVRDALVMIKDGADMPTLGRSFYQHIQAKG